MDNYNQNSIRHKSGLLNLAAELGNIYKPCRIIGVSRDIFYCYQTAQDTGGIEALFNVRRRKPNRKNRVEEITEEAVVQFVTEYPVYGQARTSKELCKRGIFVSPSGVCSIWLTHDLADFKQRLSGLEEKSAERDIVLSEPRVQALERKQQSVRFALLRGPPHFSTIAFGQRVLCRHSSSPDAGFWPPAASGAFVQSSCMSDYTALCPMRTFLTGWSDFRVREYFVWFSLRNPQGTAAQVQQNFLSPVRALGT